MEKSDENQNKEIITFFDNELHWWTDVYREDLPRGFFSFEMRQRMKLVVGELTEKISTIENPDVLECGCGPGDLLALLEPLRCRRTGLDVNRRYLDMAATRVPDAVLVEGDVEHLPFPDASFDIVFAVGLFLYVKDDRLAAREIARVTRNGGVVLMSVPNYRMLHLLLDPYYVARYIWRIFKREKEPPGEAFDYSKMRRYTMAQMRDLFHEHGFDEIRTVMTSYGPLRFWRKEILPLPMSIRISEFMRNLSNRKNCGMLKRVGNHMIMTLRKGPPADKGLPQ